MIVKKTPIDPGRVREIPEEGFSWIDRRFVRDGFIHRLPPEAILLYFFLAAVSDAQGLSFCADPTTGKILKLNPEGLTQSRARLIKAELIAYRYREKTGLDRHSYFCDPRLVDPANGDYRLAPDSPVRKLRPNGGPMGAAMEAPAGR